MPSEEKSFVRQIASGLFWVACGKGAQTALQLLVMLVLARLIAPADFGLLAAAMIVVGFSEIITELGFEAAIVQREQLDQEHLTTAFTTSLAFSTAAAGGIYLLAPAAARFFNAAQFEPVLQVLVWLFPLRALATVGEALALRALRFRWLAARDTFSFGAGYFIFGIGLALLGYGVWALVAANLSAALLKTTLVLYAYPPPGVRVTRRAFRELFYFGGGHTLARVTNYLALQGDNLVVARLLDLYSLGIYSRAYQLMSVPASVFGQILDRVLFPSLAKLQNEKKRLADAYLRGVGLIALVMLPASIVGILLAPEIVQVLLGEAWAGAMLPFRILLLGLLMRTSYKLSDSLARATGAVYRRAWRQAIYAAAVIGGAWLGHFWGVAGVAGGVLAAVVVNFLLMAGLSLKIIERRPRDFLAAHLPAVRAAGASAAIVAVPLYALRRINCPSILILLIACLLLTSAAALLLVFFPRLVLGAQTPAIEKLLRALVPARHGHLIRFGTAKSAG